MTTSPRAICGAIFQLLHDVLVGEAVKAIAPHAFVVIGARQRESVGDERMAAMESGVEAGDLRRPRKRLHRRFDPREVVRLVEGRERDQGAQARRASLRRSEPARQSPGPPCTTLWPTAATEWSGPALLSQSRMAPMAARWSTAAMRLVEADLRLFAGGRLDLALGGGRPEPLDLARRHRTQFCSRLQAGTLRT